MLSVIGELCKLMGFFRSLTKLKPFPIIHMLLLTLYVIGGKQSEVENPRMPLPGVCLMGAGVYFITGSGVFMYGKSAAVHQIFFYFFMNKAGNDCILSSSVQMCVATVRDFFIMGKIVSAVIHGSNGGCF